MAEERDYVLGTHDAEIERLGLQHRVWRPRALDAWRRAGFTVGQTLLDIGCGPGFASLDLADVVGPRGRVHAVDRSRRFLDALEGSAQARGQGTLSTWELDLSEAELPVQGADGAWARWVFAFVPDPRDLLVRVHHALRPGGTLVLHEYFDYRTWRMIPRCPEQEAFVSAVMESWRAQGGEPDIALDLSVWLEELGFRIQSLQPLIDIVPPSNFVWEWPKAFIDVGLKRLVELGRVDQAQAENMAEAMERRFKEPHVRMVTPAVMELIAVKG